MLNDSYITVLNPDTYNLQWITNTEEAIEDAVNRGCLYQSVYKFSFIPNAYQGKSPCTGDLFLTANIPFDAPVGILALRRLLDGVKSAHPELDLSMLGCYMENTGRVLVTIPASLLGGDYFSVYQRDYHRSIISRFYLISMITFQLALQILKGATGMAVIN